MKIKNVMVAGAGTLGSQIARQAAFRGFDVSVYDAFELGLDACKDFHQHYAETFMSEPGASQSDIDQTHARLRYTTNLSEAAQDADILSESIPENVEIKIEFYQALARGNHFYDKHIHSVTQPVSQ